MPSPGYGENGSVIGPQNVPTSSVASGVWSLGEYSEAQRDGIWPNPQGDFELLATATVTSDVQSITIGSIPQTYRDLKIVIRAATTDTLSDTTWIQPNSDTTQANYKLLALENINNGGGAGSQSYTHFSYGTNQHPRGTWPQGSNGRGSLNERTALETYIPNYTNAGLATSGSMLHTISGANNNIASPPNNNFVGISGSTLALSAAITSIRIIEPQANAAYYYATGTQISLYGIGQL